MDRISSKKILIVEDEAPIADLIGYSLRKEGFVTKWTNKGQDVLNSLNSFKPDLIILDLMLPDISGFDVCREINKTYSIPIIILTARADITDKILGLELGADDYITKPFDMREVIIRIRSIFRRIDVVIKNTENKNFKSIWINDDIELIQDEHRVKNCNKNIELTPKEYDLLLLLAQNRGRVFSRNELLDKVWGFEYVGDTRTVDIHVQRLRKKLCGGKSINIIETVFGIGYKLIKN
ncbi:two-component system, OmpR family, alkaline phosphatase synthesis response regulator PhoP [Clostridium cavendishii DSM 21758]|uniref:Stage 0 sporulation protein A homolog n=1 Tax=Clostridium cavendishii DSM 21758 TaxID=1121302 RepID=A0A1M6V5I4_9CLOT|nr:response regulator transcription factor [Clostridium cavendishii]SHK76723.1 two-component system, OmpR family, alkaline phosphatase synthesis response regulator PhoP [Clostridium cavendishii DSM 21758]